MPLVSVIIPAFNTEAYLRECLDSVLAQTLTDIEVICVNDGSVDGTLGIMQEYAAKHPKIRAIDQVNRGLSAARNAGTKAASGKYLYFMDSDDRVEPRMLEELTDRCEQYQLDVLFFSGDSFFESEALRERHGNYETYYLRTGQYPDVTDGKNLFLLMRQQKDYIPSACLQIIRRAFLTEAGVAFEDGLLHEDNLFTLEEILKAQRAGCVNEIYFHRRVRDASLMTEPKTWKHLRGYFICLVKGMQVADRADVTDFETREEIRKTLSGFYGHVCKIYEDLPEKERQTFRRSVTDEQLYLFDVVMQKDIESRRKTKRVQATIGYRAEETVKKPLRKVRDVLKRSRK